MIKFSEMKYERPDLNEAKAKLTSLTEQLREADSYETARKVFLEKDMSFRHVRTMNTIARIRHDINTKDEFYPKAKRTPSIGVAGYYRMGGDEFAQ